MKTAICFGVLSAALFVLLAPATTVQATNYTDVDILNFALNLECLEAEFYSWVANSNGIAAVDSTLVGNNSALNATNSGGQPNPGGTTFSSHANGDPNLIAVGLATEIAANEIAHVKFLRTALTSAGATPVPCPALSLSPETFLIAATAAAKAAGVTLDSTSTFNPYNTAGAFFLAAFIFEDVGVTAYHGAIANLQNPAYASAAAGIMAIEAGHAAVIREQLFLLAGASTSLFFNGAAVTFQQAVDAIASLRDKVDGFNSTTSQESNLTTSSSGPLLFPSDVNGVAYTRTPSQVLDIVYLGSHTTPGGFLPSGATGNSDVLQITASSSKTCSSGALSMASMSLVSVAVMAVAAVFAM
ncbi:hypothetical protein WJX77_006222 [Trebouxia sp. C0004]